MTGEAKGREALGRIVRQIWVAWASEQTELKPSWLIAWDDLDDGQREVDMRIGAAVAAAERDRIADLADRLGATVPSAGGPMPFGRVIRLAGNDAAPEPDRATCGRCGASLARASWRLPWTASKAADPVWCVVDGVWQAHKPAESAGDPQ
jgi:hypothetical protein